MYRGKLVAAKLTLVPSIYRTATGPSSIHCDLFIVPASKYLSTNSIHPPCFIAIAKRHSGDVSITHCCSAASRLSSLQSSLSIIHRYSSSATSGGEPGWLKQRWVKFMTIVRAFANGTKSLYKDMVRMREIQSKQGSRDLLLGRPPVDPSTGQVTFPLTWEELYFTVKTKHDLKRMLPTIVLFFIPFLGYFVPLVAFMYPHRFLTPHFLTEEQRGELMASSHKKMLARTKDLSEILKVGQDSELHSFLYKASDMFRSGQVASDVIKTTEKSRLSLKNVKRENMGSLVDVWAMRSWLPFGRSRQRKKLARHMKYIYTSDWLIKLVGLHSLSQDALADICCERRLDVDLKSVQDMKKKLNIWLSVTTSFEECPDVLLAHLPGAQYLNNTNKPQS